MRFAAKVLWAWLCIVCLGSSPAGAAGDPIEAAIENVTVLVRPWQVGYATIWDGNRFVQCHRVATGAMFCEAAGTLMQPSLKAVLTPDRTARLKEQGWTLDTAFGNYVQIFAPDLSAAQVARSLRTTLVEGYGADPAKFGTSTQWVADVKCPPRVTYSQDLAGSVNGMPSMALATRRMCSYVPGQELAPAWKVETVDDLMRLAGTRLMAELQRLRINAGKPGFVAVETGIGYVQCMAETDPDGIYCEAQSAESWPALSAVLTPERVARLHADGYADPGGAPNYAKAYPATRYSDQAIAKELFEILFHVYGYRGAQPLAFKTN